MRWLRRKADDLSTELIGAALVALIVLAWGLVSQLPAVLVFAVTLVCAAALLTAANQYLGLRDRRDAGRNTAEHPVNTPPTMFPPYWLQTEVDEVNCAGLWWPEPSLNFVIRVLNLSAWRVTLAGLTGHIACDGFECNADARLIRTPIDLPTSDYQYSVSFRQPITAKMAEGLQAALVEEGSGVSILFAQNLTAGPFGLNWVGKAEHPGGSMEFTVPVVFGPRRDGETIRLRGPVKPERGPQLVRATTFFMSTKVFDLTTGIRNVTPMAPPPTPR
jgi:hypothetical protein